jgi:hypothetical protein
MGEVLKLIWWADIWLFRSRASLEAEILALRHQLHGAAKKGTDSLSVVSIASFLPISIGSRRAL